MSTVPRTRGVIYVSETTVKYRLVTMCEKGVSGGGVNIKDPKPLYIMEYEWGVKGDFGH